METYFTADLHLGHLNILQHADRPFSSVEKMDTAIINNWNSVVTQNDTVVIVGDFAWKNHKRYLQALNGKKILIKGNHDKMAASAANCFEGIYDIRTIKLKNNIEVVCCHYCMESWSKSHHGAFHVYGHSHGRKQEDIGMLRCDVGVDVWNYFPVHADMLIYKMDQFRKKMTAYNASEKAAIVDENLNRNKEYINAFRNCHCGNDCH